MSLPFQLVFSVLPVKDLYYLLKLWVANCVIVVDGSA